MNRQYTAEQYLNIIKSLKAAVPEITFSTDVIVGFPGETDDDFNATRNLMLEVGFSNAYIFKYSPRSGTPAAEMEQQIPKQVKEERNHLLLDDLKKVNSQYNQRFIDTVQQVLVEGPSKRNPKRWTGKTSNAKYVMFPPAADTGIGDIVNVSIERCTHASLFGTLT
jgi:tRNA-2-methylthio-N6-dimethylallyladenosine synthase